MKEIIISEANFLEQLLYELYIGREEFTTKNWNTIRLRLLAIRDEARKKDD